MEDGVVVPMLQDQFAQRREQIEGSSFSPLFVGDFHQGRGLRIDLLLGTKPVADRGTPVRCGGCDLHHRSARLSRPALPGEARYPRALQGLVAIACRVADRMTGKSDEPPGTAGQSVAE